MSRLRLQIIAGMIGIFLLSLAGPAAGAVVVKEHFVDADIHIDRNFCGSDIDFRHELRYRVYFSVKSRKSGTPLYFAARFNGYDRYTNLDTGKTFTLENRGQVRDHKITVNPDGTLTIVEMNAGLQVVRDDAGNVLFRDRGVFRVEFVVDYNGTLTNPDDDEFVEDHGIIFSGGKFETADRDFCADLLTFTA